MDEFLHSVDGERLSALVFQPLPKVHYSVNYEEASEQCFEYPRFTAMLTNGLLFLASRRRQFLEPLVPYASLVKPQRVSRFLVQGIGHAIAFFGNMFPGLLQRGGHCV